MARDFMAGPGVVTAQAAADDAFGVDLYRVLGVTSGNTVFSPASIAAALRMVLCGARGQTATEIARALHLGDSATAETGRAGLRLLSEVAAQGDGGTDLTLRAPNTMWVQDGYPLLPTFTDLLRDAAAVAVRQADFHGGPDQARAEINRLIADQTAGKITDLLGPRTIHPDTRLVLSNAIYLKAAWASPFPGQATDDAPFYPDGQAVRDGDGVGQSGGTGDAGGQSAGIGGEALMVRMMRHSTDLPYVRGDDYQAVLLPYKDGRLAMAVVLPDGPLSTLQPRLSAGGLGGLLAETARRRVALTMPKFRLRASFGLIPALRQLGIRSAFDTNADFSGITAEPLAISAVAHQAYIDVDEQGTEAAAATAIAMRTLAARRMPDPVTMTVDRPFLFAIIDTPSGLPLFFGQVARPNPA